MMSMWILLTISTNCTGWCNFVVFEKFTSAYHTKLRGKFCHYLLIIYMKKRHRKLRQTKYWKHVHAICNLHLCYYTWECTHFQPIRSTSFFFMNIITIVSRLVMRINNFIHLRTPLSIFLNPHETEYDRQKWQNMVTSCKYTCLIH